MPQTHSQVHSLFPVPVGSYSGFSAEEPLKSYLLSLLDEREPRINSQDPGLRHWFDSQGKGVLAIDDPLINDFKSWIITCALDFIVRVQGYQCDSLQVISSWLNCADIGASQPPHSHENSWLSATYYVCFNEGHSPIRFWKPGVLMQPNMPYLSMATHSIRTPFNSNEIQISPSSGTLLLWPSHLLHGHSGNSLDRRVSLSMNLMPNRLVGKSYGLNLSSL